MRGRGFSWRTSGGAAGAREGTLVCFLRNPTRLAKLCRAAYLFIHLPEGSECCPDTSGALKGEENSSLEFSYLHLDS